MVKNRKLSRAISDAGWSKFKTMLAAKCEKYGRDLTVIDRWYPSSQICSCCGQSGGRKELDIREWECLFCKTTIHDRANALLGNLRPLAAAKGGEDVKSYRSHLRKFPLQSK